MKQHAISSLQASTNQPSILILNNNPVTLFEKENIEVMGWLPIQRANQNFLENFKKALGNRVKEWNPKSVTNL